jgi:2-oxoglutarate dehydrogenase E1 component
LQKTSNAQRPTSNVKLGALVAAVLSAKFVWCQEEPENMGAWTFIEPRLRTLFCTEIAYAGREASASPAVGALARHKREQARLVADAFTV